MRNQQIKTMGIAAAMPIFAFLPTEANDGVYVTSGNQLIPLEETNISINSEVLTICLTDSGQTLIDVSYELYNPGQERTVVMGFEADPTYNIESELNPQGVHPYIKNFSVEMNGQTLCYQNAVAFIPSDRNAMEKVDLTRWKNPDEALDISQIYDVSDTTCVDTVGTEADENSLLRAAYVYYFTAKFVPGVNRVHHTYAFTNSYSIGLQYSIDYKLTPAARWASSEISDFTLRIAAHATAKYFRVNRFSQQTLPTIVEGEGRVRVMPDCYESDSVAEIALRDGMVEWHLRNFCPQKELAIQSADMSIYSVWGDDVVPPSFGAYYDRGIGYIPQLYGYDKQTDRRILRNLPYASRGYVFRDKRLRDYFSEFYWYMPDATYKPSTSDFTPQELRYIQEKTSGEESE